MAAAFAMAAALAAALFAVAVAAEDRPGLDDARAFVERIADEAVRTWAMDHTDEEARLQAMNSLVHETFAIDFITRAVVGRYWRKLGPAEQEEFRTLFPRFVVRIYLPHIAKYSRDHLRIDGARARGKRDVVVRSKVRGAESSEWIETDWRIRTIDGELRVLDIVVAGVSLILVQRQEFEAVIRKDGFASLVEQLRERAESSDSARG
ncbi:MAG: ABC transporter substrate-binding protein [Immundisolibacterales bacterium]|nr:ABC transporter substrate-binding protein [Immundisolibacterales bacterium]